MHKRHSDGLQVFFQATLTLSITCRHSEPCRFLWAIPLDVLLTWLADLLTSKHNETSRLDQTLIHGLAFSTKTLFKLLNAGSHLYDPLQWVVWNQLSTVRKIYFLSLHTCDFIPTLCLIFYFYVAFKEHPRDRFTLELYGLHHRVNIWIIRSYKNIHTLDRQDLLWEPTSWPLTFIVYTSSQPLRSPKVLKCMLSAPGLCWVPDSLSNNQCRILVEIVARSIYLPRLTSDSFRYERGPELAT